MSLITGLGRFPWRRKWQPTPIFLLGKSHGRGSLVGYSPWGHKELDMTEVTARTPSTKVGFFLAFCQYAVNHSHS